VFFIPLILYALYGVKKSIDRRIKRKQREAQEEEKSKKHA